MFVQSIHNLSNFIKSFMLFALINIANLNCLDFSDISNQDLIVISTKQIKLNGFEGAFNPSLIEFKDGYLLTFRFIPDAFQHWNSYVGVVLLDKKFNIVSTPQILNTRVEGSKTSSQTEDARVFSYRGRLFIIYNDNLETVHPYTWERRDMYMAELLLEEEMFFLSAPKKLIHLEKYPYQVWQKNWVPFEWNKTLLFTYFINPHEIIYPNLIDGTCVPFYQTSANLKWDYGSLRGSTPPRLVGDEYLAFFHSGTFIPSPASNYQYIWHYFMGAYTFSSNPPFEITQISTLPIFHHSFYTSSSREKRVVFPGGFVVSGPKIHIAYGKDDCEMWIATLDYEALKESLVPVTH